jgi:predicted ATPase/DNA-binding SARP family transcriptional activator
VDFRILGPLEVMGVHGPVTVRGPKRRGLLALLVVHSGQRLTVDRIVEGLWGAAGSPAAARTVQAYVSQLRRVIDDPRVSLVANEGGYTLDVPADAVDATRFERLVREAGDIADPAERVARLDRALELWRGAALEEFADDAWAASERARLDMLRLQAVEQHVEARLALGRHRELIAELEALVDEHPLDERLWAHLLVALYRSGRQADALRAYERLRHTLAEELGIDPSPELAALERQILDHDASLDAPAPAATQPTAAPALPRGTVTFLFTDLGDSTRLWESHPEEMSSSLARHDALAKAVIEDHDGHLVKSTGDGVMAVFANAPDAGSAAIELQRRLSAEEWPVPIAVRMGLHTGIANPTHGDYHAPTVNRAARVASAAHPGQILVTAATAALTESLTLHDLGEHELRGMPPTRLFQVVAPELRVDFPRPTTGARPADLPSPPTSFVGRNAELVAVSRLLADHRLVTLTGAGGCGKTRLAIEVAEQIAADFPDGVRFVDLATATADSQVADAVMDALGLAMRPDASDPLTRLGAYLADREVLCVLDNCEHVLDASAEIAQAVLAQAGASRLLITSREPVGVIGEQVYVVPSLDVDTEAVQLFADRAAEARAGFTVDDTNRPTITEICRRLDGIPLAIELAAATIAHLSPVQVLERLDDRFQLLTGGRRRVQRHQTLAATLDWSHDLLSPEEQMVLRRLAAFPASFSLEAAQDVVDVGDLTETLGSLVAKSLVQVVDAGERLRYRLLESVRLYAETKLAAADESTVFRTRHRDWVVDWLESVPLEERWLGDVDYLATEQPGIMAALDWSSARREVPAVARIAAGFDWSRSETWREAWRICEKVLADDDLSPELRLQVHMMLWWLGPLEFGGAEPGQQAVAASAGIESPLAALALAGHGRNATVPAVERRDDNLLRRAIEWADAGVAMSEQFSAPWRMYCLLIAGMAHAVGQIATSLGMAPVASTRADSLFAAGTEISPPVHPYRNLHSALAGYLAITQLISGNTSRALGLARQAYDNSQGPHPGAPLPYWHHSRGMALVATLGEVGDHAAARHALRESHELIRRTDWVHGPQSTLLLGGVLAAQRGDWANASRLLAAGAPAFRRTPADALLYVTYRDRVRDALGAERARQLKDEGRAMTLDDAMKLALR